MTALSLRLRLTLVTAGLLCLALVAGAFALTLVVSGSRVNALDGIARDRAAALVRLVEDDRVPESLPVSEPGEVAQVLDAAGRVVATSPNASRTLPVLPADTLVRLRAVGGSEGVVQSTEESPYDPRARVAVLPATHRGEPVTVVVTVPLREVEGVLRALRVSLMGVVPTLTLLLAAAIWLALGRALHPVDQLRRAAAQVAREGGPGALPVPRADDELGALARTLNEMLDRLEGAAARQRSFVADAAHELRSPISALRATVEAALAHPAAWMSAELAADPSRRCCACRPSWTISSSSPARAPPPRSGSAATWRRSSGTPPPGCVPTASPLPSAGPAKRGWTRPPSAAWSATWLATPAATPAAAWW